MLYHLLYPLSEYFGAFRVVKYITFRIAAATLTAMFISFILGPFVIRLLSKKQVGQQIRDDGPLSHLKKAGTPTMGGLLILLAILFSSLLWARLDNAYVWVVLLVTVGLGGIGFLDDFLKLRQKNSHGLSARSKIFLQLGIGLIAITLLLLNNLSGPGTHFYFPDWPLFDTQLYFPFFKHLTPNLGWLCIPWMLIVILGTSNSVNLTDGLDGLAIGPIMTAGISFLICSYAAGHANIAGYLQVPNIPGAGELAIICGTLFGAGLGFLWFNTYPAQVFMGDVGSLALGGTIAMVALIIKQELLLVLVGGVFVAEALSVIAQVTSFKLTGKRILRMAPIHHHFELKGWAEPKVIVRFWIISIILSLIALSSLKLR
jgi:phospho-N-acetylmuramoyl-pentapeptide-transferase